MKERIIQIMNSLQMKPSSFANATKIKLTTLSQIINNRSNPSLEVVKKIHTAFPSLNIEWILYGEGEMYIGEPPQFPIVPEALSCECQSPLNPDERTDEPENRKDFASIEHKEAGRSAETEAIRYIERPAKKIKEIKIFYDDDTYETFVPQK